MSANVIDEGALSNIGVADQSEVILNIFEGVSEMLIEPRFNRDSKCIV